MVSTDKKIFEIVESIKKDLQQLASEDHKINKEDLFDIGADLTVFRPDVNSEELAYALVSQIARTMNLGV